MNRCFELFLPRCYSRCLQAWSSSKKQQTNYPGVQGNPQGFMKSSTGQNGKNKPEKIYQAYLKILFLRLARPSSWRIAVAGRFNNQAPWHIESPIFNRC
jgi:hypothetical protein